MVHVTLTFDQYQGPAESWQYNVLGQMTQRSVNGVAQETYNFSANGNNGRITSKVLGPGT